MGWTFTRREPGLSDARFFAREWGPEFAAKIKAFETKGSVFYAVLETDAEKEPSLEPDANGKVRLCIVVLMETCSDSYNFGWKEMTEFGGPVVRGCPERLLNMLSPFKPDAGERAKYAIKWRADCRANAKAAA